jgi:hypothetical protein
MRKLLRLFWLDWSRAPLSGTVALGFMVDSCWNLFWGSETKGLLLLILLNLTLMQRGPMPKDEGE